MINFIFGRSGYGKSEYLKNLILKEINFNNKTILITPEQSSFETEKNLLEFLGNQNFSKIQVLNFSGLSKFVSNMLEIPEMQPINNIKQILTLNKTLYILNSQLKIYKKSSNNIKFMELLLNTIQELKSNKITVKILEKILKLSKKELLKQKIQEIILIYDTFNKVYYENYQESSDVLNYIEILIKNHNIFSDYIVFIDEFDSFNAQQISIVEHIILQSSKIYMSFCTDNLNTNYYLFNNINNTVNKIKKIAQKNSVKFKILNIFTYNKRANNQELRTLEQNLFLPNKTKNHNIPENIFLYSGFDIHDECEFIVKTIKNLIITEKYYYKDFAILIRNNSDYPEILKNLFKKSNIKYFLDFPEKLFNKNLTNFILSVFEIILYNYDYQDIIKLLKTGLVNISTEEISLLENYVLLWKIRSKNWLSNFTMHPEGWYKNFEPKDIELLNKINETRQKIINPIENFKSKINNSTGKEISVALFELILDLNVPENFRKFCYEATEKYNFESAEKYSFIWDSVINTLSQVAQSLENTKISLNKYYEFLKYSLNTVDCSYVPQNIDSILITSLERVRLFNKKIVFVVGAISGEFPKNPEFSEIFNNNDINYINSLGIDFNKNIENSLIKERFLAYKALTCASDKIFVSWYTVDLLKKNKVPSEIIYEIKNIFPNIKILSNQDSYIIHDILDCQENNINISESRLNFKDSLKLNKLLGEKLILSTSQLEKYYTCKFGYFCQYILNLKSIQNNSFQSLDYGNLIHYILEKLTKKYVNLNSNLNLEQNLSFDIDNLLNNYVIQKLGGFEDKSKLFYYQLKNIKKTLTFLIYYFIEESRQSKFKILETELEIPELKLDILDKKSVSIIGKIDRIDIMSLNNQNYFRIIDYKTSSKDFKLSNILYGINMQMLIYLLSIFKNNKNLIPAGILYFKALRPILDLKTGSTSQKLEPELKKFLKMDGLIVENKDIILGMEPESQGKYIPILVKNDEIKNSDTLIKPEELETLFNYIENKIKQTASNIFSGDFAVSPIILNNNKSCKFCKFHSICLHEKDEYTKIQNFTNKNMINIIKNI